MEPDLTWMIGRSFANVVAQEGGSWAFQFGDAIEVRSDSPWRIVSAGRIVLSSGDHGQWYGLSHPIDAESECRGRVVGSAILSVDIREETRDLIIMIESGDRLEIIPISSGYESWQITGPDGLLLIARGGGNLTTWRPAP